MNRIVINEDLSNCCGCSACAAMCPKQAISMKENAYGFFYPYVDDSQCIQCGKCVWGCSFQTVNSLRVPQEAFAAKGCDERLVKKSASGGIFASLAKEFLLHGGLISGAVLEFQQEFVAVFHILSEDFEDLKRIQGSKYVQSSLQQCYEEIQTALKSGREVLFSGTPCQVAAIKRVTGNPDNLMTIDLICHGVPSRKMLQDYLQIINKRYHATANDLCFREKKSKRAFTARVGLQTIIGKKHLYLKSSQMSYYDMFLKGIIYRESCYSCPYAGISRISDLTIGDYWGIERYHTEELEVSENDWSCVIVNTDKGHKFLDKHGKTLILQPTNIEWIRENNQQLNSPSKKNEERQIVLTAYKNRGYSMIENMFIRKNGGYLRYHWRVLKFQKNLNK